MSENARPVVSTNYYVKPGWLMFPKTHRGESIMKCGHYRMDFKVKLFTVTGNREYPGVDGLVWR